MTQTTWKTVGQNLKDRLGENLAWGRYLYVDDLVTLPAQRSLGHGAA